VRFTLIRRANKFLDVTVGDSRLKVRAHALGTKNVVALVELDAVLAGLVGEAHLAQEIRIDELDLGLVLVVDFN
jgi:hypothetical protein